MFVDVVDREGAIGMGKSKSCGVDEEINSESGSRMLNHNSIHGSESTAGQRPVWSTNQNFRAEIQANTRLRGAAQSWNLPLDWRLQIQKF